MTRCKRFAFYVSFFLAASAALSAQDPAIKLYREAEVRFQKGDYLFALQRYDELIERYPVSAYVADSQFRKAVILYRTGKAEEALTLLNRVERRYASTRFFPYVPFWKGVISFSLERYEEAESELSAYLEGSPDQLVPDAWRYLALARKRLGEGPAAADAALAALESLPDRSADPYTLSLALSLLLDAEREAEALSFIGPVNLEQFSEEWRKSLAFYKGEALFRAGEVEDSVEYFRQALDAPPETAASAYGRLYGIYRELERDDARLELYDRAMVALAGVPDMLNRFLLQAGIEQFHEKALELSESNLRRVMRTTADSGQVDLAVLYLARIYNLQDKTGEAVKLLKGREQSAGELSGELLYTLAAFLADEQEWEEAARRLDRYLARFSGSARREEAEYLRAYCEYRSGNFRKALDLVDNIFAAGYSGKNTNRLLRLKSRVHVGLKDYASGIDTLLEYIPLSPDDSEALVDLLRLRYQQKEYRKVLESAPGIITDNVQQKNTVEYLLGLSLVALKEYEEAMKVFDRLLSGSPDGVTESYALFYAGWSAYRIGEYADAERRFSRLVRDYPDHELALRSEYMKGWVFYSMGSYPEAAVSFGEYGQRMEGRQAEEGIFMYAKSHAAAGDSALASAAFQSLIGQKGSPYADDALYEYAQLMHNLGKDEEAGRSYYQLWQQYKNSPFAEDALYNRGELLFLNGQYEDASEAFYFYRTRFPRGKLFDASLHYGALAADRAGAPFRAILLWEKLLDEHPKSSFYPDALEGTAGLYRDVGEYRKAIGLYTRLITFFPAQAGKTGAEREVETLRRILEGSGQQEAALQVTVDKEGTGSRKGAEAMVELARMYLNRYDRKETEALDLLTRLTDKAAAYPAAASEAYYLLGELAIENGDARAAVERFLESAAVGDDDTSARALYRAAEVAKDAGDRALSERMVRQLEMTFPGSEWAVRGRELIGGSR
jgi:tetratricopeptide (TPR) repeat protein